MGLVFEPERVEAGNIPAHAEGLSQYEAAVALGSLLAEVALKQSHKDPALMAYMLYGSSVERFLQRATRRSDVDLLVVVDESNRSQVMPDVESRIVTIEQSWNVDVNAIVFDRGVLEGPSKLSPFYTDHLCSHRGFAVYANQQFFAHAFNTNPKLQQAIFGTVPFVDAWPFAEAYLRARRAKFQSQLDQTEPDLTDLKGAFELPRNLGRTLVDMFDKYVREHLDNIDPDIAAVTLTDYNELPQHRLLEVARLTDTLGLIEEDVEALSYWDDTYTALLEDTVAGRVSIREYESWLRGTYKVAMEQAFKLVSVAGQIVLRTVELAQVDPQYDQVSFDDLIIHPDYMDEEPWLREQHVLEHRATQIEPVDIDLDQLLFTIAPKHPEYARLYSEEQERRREQRRLDDELTVEFMREEK